MCTVLDEVDQCISVTFLSSRVDNFMRRVETDLVFTMRCGGYVVLDVLA